MAEDGLADRHPSPPSRRLPMAYDVVSNATLWFCHHHLFDLARRPRFDRHWHEAWDGYRRLNRAVRRRGRREAARSGHGAGAGLPPVPDRRPCWPKPGPTCGRCTSATPRSPTRRAARPARGGRRRAAGRAWPASGPAGSTPSAGRRPSGAAYADPELADDGRHRPAPGHLRRAARPGPGRPRGRGGLGRPWPRPTRARPSASATASSSSGSTGSSSRRTSSAGSGRSRSSSRPGPNGAGGWSSLALAYPSREGLAEYLATAPRSSTRWRGSTSAWAPPTGRPIVLDVADDRDRSVAALARYDVLLVNPVRDGMNLVAKEGPLVNRPRRGAGAVPRGRRLGRAAAGGRRDQPVRRDRHGRRPSTWPCRWTPAERARRAGRLLRDHRAGRTASDWLADQLAEPAGAPGQPAGFSARQPTRTSRASAPSGPSTTRSAAAATAARALRVDHRHPGHGHPARGQLVQGGEGGRSPRSSPKQPRRWYPAQLRDHRPLVDGDPGRSSSGHPAGLDDQPGPVPAGRREGAAQRLALGGDRASAG